MATVSTRKPGFYWVMPSRRTWMVAEWKECGGHWYWLLHGSQYAFDDEDFEHVGKRVPHPIEVGEQP